ncbi:MAG TPA: hypothetical protein VFN35_23525, partial [Ktedonobacteraceae bacterium]|nr:hypothetical protein [Ktedonobacteraceae bacterium]
MIRPPIGVFNLSDVLLTVLMILLAHIFYVVLPSWMAVGLFALAALSALYCALSPLVHIRLLALLISLVLIAGDIGAAWLFGVQNNGFLLVNNLVILLIIISISNLWVQSGLKARDAAIFSV